MKILARLQKTIKAFFQKEPPLEYEVTQFVISDRQPITGASKISFFVNNSEPDVSVTRTFENENDVIDWLISNDNFKQMLYRKLFSSSSVIHHCGVKEPITEPKKKPGDIDILLYKASDESNAVGIECKIVKSESLENQSPKINKITSVQKKGTKQADGYVKIGFSRVFLMVILLDDGRHYKNPNFVFRTTPTEELKELYNFDWNTKMNKDVGIIYAYISQLTSNHINQTKGLGLRIEREAKERFQNKELTEKIKNLNH
ncbi:hypothetical protein PY092_12950 [Muricauda sp. 334s03]|uniref:Restriction endonuclease n=1 Tax=Flagellimonas yonaguniensis TaxID=3031325 RepID=A0ABT5Y0U6_9FLAO|nr:hypothetical protein [[Muricauda] yonaguniensis]MDF0717063.1 hypothetical protein [[Muricauda] yonaguniensis]